MLKPMTYPFVPKSTAHLEPGHFWSLPLLNGGYACGRVLQLRLADGKRDSRIFFAGLMDWSGASPPTADAIAGRAVVERGAVHVKTIRENRGEVLGFRDLALDGIEPGLFRNAMIATHVQRGFDVIRKADRARDGALPVLSAWGFGVIQRLAEKHFGKAPHPGPLP